MLLDASSAIGIIGWVVSNDAEFSIMLEDPTVGANNQHEDLGWFFI